MFKKHLLYLTDQQLFSVVRQRGQFGLPQIFPANEQGLAAFSSYLAGKRLAPTYLLIDVVEEDFRLDAIPHVGKRDHAIVVERKLSQLYRNTPFRYALTQGRETEGRRDDRILFTAITNPDVVTPWVDALNRARVPLAGIYSAPLLSAHLLKPLRIEADNALLVTLEHGAGLRQSYFQRGEIKFSRLTPVSEISGGLPPFIAEEVSKTWQYLDSLRHFPRSEGLDVYLVCHQDDAQSLPLGAFDSPYLRYRLLDIRDVATAIGLRTPLKRSPDGTPDSSLGSSLDSSYASEIFLHLLATQATPNHFASSEQTRLMSVWRARLGLLSSAAAAATVAAAWSVTTLVAAAATTAETDRIEREIAALTQQYHRIESSFPPSAVPTGTLQNSVSIYNLLLRDAPRPESLLVKVSAVLDRFPNIQLNQLIWMATNDANALPPYSPSKGNDQATVKTASGASAVTPVNGGAPANTDTTAGKALHAAVLEGQITSFNGNYRVALAEIERLIAALNRVPAMQASALSLPLDVAPQATLQGKSSAAPDTGRPAFTVKIVWAAQQ